MALALQSTSAVAAEPPAPATPGDAQSPPSDLTPPSLTSTPVVAYPDGAHGDAVVVLMLTVGRDGVVEAARAIEGDEPFTGAATAAAATWKFEPARRQGQPVAARIRFEVRFREPPAEDTDANGGGASGRGSGEPTTTGTAPGATGSAATGAAPRTATPAPPTEITIVGQRSPPGVSTFTRAEVRQLPGAFGDPFRAIEALPGVTPIVSGIPFFYLRGARRGTSATSDGVRVPYLYHVGLGPR